MTEQLKNPKPDYVGHRRRLREKFFKAGSEGLHDYETIELLLAFAIPRIDTKPLAKRLIQKFGSFARVLDAPLEKLREVEGMGEQASSLFPILKSSMELYLAEDMKRTDALNSPDAVIRYCQAALGGEKNEVFLVLYLSSKNRVIGTERLSEGTIDHAPVYPRRIIEGALKANAAGIIFVHNHPSGDPTPSPQDKSLTQEIAATAKPLGVEVHDHLIIGKGGYFSFRASGLMGTKKESISNGT